MKQRDLGHPASRLGFAEPPFDSGERLGHRYADKLEVRAAKLKAPVGQVVPPPQNAPLIIQVRQHVQQQQSSASEPVDTAEKPKG